MGDSCWRPVCVFVHAFRLITPVCSTNPDRVVNLGVMLKRLTSSGARSSNIFVFEDDQSRWDRHPDPAVVGILIVVLCIVLLLLHCVVCCVV